MRYRNNGPDFVMPEGLHSGKKYKHGKTYDITEIPPQYVNVWFFAEDDETPAENPKQETPAETDESPKLPGWDDEEDNE